MRHHPDEMPPWRDTTMMKNHPDTPPWWDTTLRRPHLLYCHLFLLRPPLLNCHLFLKPVAFRCPCSWTPCSKVAQGLNSMKEENLPAGGVSWLAWARSPFSAWGAVSSGVVSWGLWWTVAPMPRKSSSTTQVCRLMVVSRQLNSTSMKRLVWKTKAATLSQ